VNPITSAQPDTLPRIADVGFGGMLVTFSDALTDAANSAALAFRAELEANRPVGLTETSTSLTSTFIAFDPHTLARETLRAQLIDLLGRRDWFAASLPEGRKLWTIPSVFGGDTFGPQLGEAAQLAGVSPDTAIAQLCETPLRVMTLGFAPGQPYLGSLPENWDLPRQTGLTKSVPIGAITVAIRQIVLFSASTPTGWRQVGQCAFHAFRPHHYAPFALTPGDEIRFVPISEADFLRIHERNDSGDGGATWEAIS